MAKTINISFKGEAAVFAYKPIDRTVLYGKRRRIAFDEALRGAPGGEETTRGSHARRISPPDEIVNHTRCEVR